MANYVALGALVMNFIFLAVILTFVGIAARKIIYMLLDSRQSERMRTEAVVARSRARSVSRAKVF